MFETQKMKEKNYEKRQHQQNYDKRAASEPPPPTLDIWSTLSTNSCQ